jgi:hypothetical protein
MTYKICTKCKISKGISEFQHNIYSCDGFSYRCKECLHLLTAKENLSKSDLYDCPT